MDKSLYQPQFTYENLLQAAHECAAGVHWKNSVTRWDQNLGRYCLRLEQDLANGKFAWSPSVKMMITSPKPRLVNSQTFRDRVVQRVMVNTGLYRDLTQGNIYDNGACQTGKGTDFMRARLICHLQRHWRHYGNRGYVLSLDIHHFFDSIPHDKLETLVNNHVQCPCYRWMVIQLIRLGGHDGIGIELGSQISQLLAVAYLTPVDWFVKQRAMVEGYVRYCDDMVLLIPETVPGPDGLTRPGIEVARALKSAIEGMVKTMGLELNPKSTIYPLREGVRFLGFRYRLTSTGKVRTIPLRKKLRAERRHLKKLLKKERLGSLKMDAVQRHFQSWSSFYRKTPGAIENLKKEIKS